MMIEVTARKNGRTVEARCAGDMPASERDYAEMLRLHRDCDVAVGDPNKGTTWVIVYARGSHAKR